MNKKIFTLLAVSLMLFMTAFGANAQQRPWIGDTLRYLPEGLGKGAYHLKVTHVGDSALTVSGAQLLSMTDKGFLTLQDSSAIFRATALSDSAYISLRAALWCVDVKRPEVLGKVPGFMFYNKQYASRLAVNNVGWNGHDFGPSEAGGTKKIISQTHGANPLNMYDVQIGGTYDIWRFSRTYNTVALETNQPLLLEVKDEPDYFMTFAVFDPSVVPIKVELVKVHVNDLIDTTVFYREHLLRFSIMNAAPRVLTAKDFNTQLYNKASEDYTQLMFNPDATEGNELAQPLWATDVSSGTGYMTLKTKGSQYVTMLDGPTAASYYSTYGKRYPKLATQATAAANGESHFRFVYYPSEDSVIANVRYINHIEYGIHQDNGSYFSVDSGAYFNMEIWNYLVVRMQDLDTAEGKRIITVANKPANTRIYFGVNDCAVDPDRTTVPTNLYTIKDQLGRYLIVPLVNGDFTPKWVNLDAYENALKTPSYQWLITQVDESSPISPIILTNREFDHIRIEFTQVYKNPTLFNGSWNYIDPALNPNATYQPMLGDAKVYYDGTSNSSFQVVNDDPVAAAKKKAGLPLTQDDWQKLYRTSPYLGYKYIAPDTLNYYAYSFNFLSYLSNEYYFGTTEHKALDKNDSLLYVEKEKTYFQLIMPDTLRAYGSEKYGIGWTDSLLNSHEVIKDVAKLQRYYYHLQINDYWKYSKKDNFLVLDDNARYVYTDEAIANKRKLNKAKFYMRFTFDANNQEYYTLLDRIDKSNFDYLTKTIGLSITDTLKAHDVSHGAINTRAFGVVFAAIDDANSYVRAKAKTGSSEVVSTFAISNTSEPLYRRFNTEKEGDKPADEPEVVQFYRTYNPKVDYIYENQHTGDAYGQPHTCMNCGPFDPNLMNNIHYAGVENAIECAAGVNDNGQVHIDHNYAIYVDTAYVNRGTGWIKPQYMLVVGPVFDAGGAGCNTCGDSIDFRPYVYGRYMINATDSSRKDPNNVAQNSPIRDNAFIWDTKWDRLAFVPAVHMGDSLYILNGVDYTQYVIDDVNGSKYLNYKALGNNPKVQVHRLDNNLHKDFVFSFRFKWKDKDDFMIESETTNRSTTQGRMIAPMDGGWIKSENHILVISRGSWKDPLLEAEIWNVEPTKKFPTSNGKVDATSVTVVSGKGAVTILNAAGKNAVISNVLGQVVANTILTSDHATINAPKGIVVVAIEGEDAVKTVVK